MKRLEISDLIIAAEHAFLTAFSENFVVASRETFYESSYRGGFRLILTNEENRCEVLYSDMQLEVQFNGKEAFGPTVHPGFAGNTFSREHLREYLLSIAASASVTSNLNFSRSESVH